MVTKVSLWNFQTLMKNIIYNISIYIHDDKVLFVKFSNIDGEKKIWKNIKKLVKDCEGKHFYNQQKIIHGDKILFVDSPKMYSMIMILFYSHPHK